MDNSFVPSGNPCRGEEHVQCCNLCQKLFGSRGAFCRNLTAQMLAFRHLLSVLIVAANLSHIFVPPSSNDATKRAHT